MNYQLVYSNKRKTIALQIKQGKVIVRAPHYISEQTIAKFVKAKEAWVLQKLALTNIVSEPAFNCQDGDILMLRGLKKRFTLSCAEKLEIVETAERLIVMLPEDLPQNINAKNYIIEQLNQWFCCQVNHYLEQHLAKFAALMQVNYQQVKTRLYRSRWGSCNNKGELTFNSLLVMVPKSVFDYVIIHELSHLIHLNHSPLFWQLVATFHPHFQKDKLWLKQHQRYLVLPKKT